MTNISILGDGVSENPFRLLTTETHTDVSDDDSIELGGSRWSCTPYTGIPSAASSPEYICISYSWGQGRTMNPFDELHAMSDRTLSVIDAVLTALHPRAIWIDAFCMPGQEPARTACLRSMGRIYGRATQVVAVLSRECSTLLERINRGDPVDPSEFLVLENDDWVTRAWTYQEIINSRSIQFITEQGAGVSVAGNVLLEAVMGAIDGYKKRYGLDRSEVLLRHPGLDIFESVIGDYMTSDVLARSVYQIMSAMHQRHSVQSDDHFNAMIGVITETPPDSPEDLAQNSAEYFMRVCETKGDYSFIYTTAPRSENVGKHWRPAAGVMPPVFAWHAHSSVQSARQYPTHLELHNMCVMNPAAMNDDARKIINWWLQREGADFSSTHYAELVLRKLKLISFSGCGEYVETNNGFFFPHSTLSCVDAPVIAVSAGVEWIFGAPGLVLSCVNTDLYRFCGVGVFVGRPPKNGNSLNID